ALIIADQSQPIGELLSALFEWPAEAIVAMTPDRFVGETLTDTEGRPFPAGKFMFALAAVAADMAENKCATLMRRLNAALEVGGSATIEVYQKLDGTVPNPPLGEAQLPDRLRDAGFSSVRCSSSMDGIIGQLIVPGLKNDSDLRFACASARKASEMA